MKSAKNGRAHREESARFFQLLDASGLAFYSFCISGTRVQEEQAPERIAFCEMEETARKRQRRNDGVSSALDHLSCCCPFPLRLSASPSTHPGRDNSAGHARHHGPGQHRCRKRLRRGREEGTGERKRGREGGEEDRTFVRTPVGVSIFFPATKSAARIFLRSLLALFEILSPLHSLLLLLSLLVSFSLSFSVL